MTTHVEIEGSCHPPGKENNYDGTFLTKENMKEKLKDLPGTPILWEHNGQKKIGEITDGYVDERQRLIVKGKIDRGTWEGAKTISSLRNGKFKGLSLGMEHLIGISADWVKIIDKKINEISVTSNPDLPETEVYYVQDDSEHFNLAKNYLREFWQTEKLKKNVYKAKSNLLELTTQLQNNTNNSIEKNTNTMENQKSNVDSPSAATPTATEENEKISGSSIDDVETLKKEIDKIQQEKQQLEEQGKQYNKLFLEFSKDPMKYHQIMLQHKQKVEDMQKEMQEKEKVVEDFITTNFLKQREPIPEMLREASKNGPNMPETYEPLYKLITVAAANQQQSQIESEKKYQEMKQQMENQIQQANTQFDQLNSEFNKMKKETSYKSKLPPYSNQTENNDGQTKKRQRSDQNQNENQNENQNDNDNNQNFNERWNTTKIDVPYSDLTSPRKGHGLQQENSVWFSQLFGGGTQDFGTGMGRMDMKGVTGHFYPPQKQGVNSQTGIPELNFESTGFEIRSDKPRSIIHD